MTFVDRNTVWTGALREFHQMQSRSGTPRVWTIMSGGGTVHTTWGQLGGKMQQATETFSGVNDGKTNFVGPTEHALDRAREMCRKKNWEGYREIIPGSGAFFDPTVASEIDFTQPLPLSLSFYKPDNSLSSGLEKKARDMHCWYTRKRNGMMKVLVKNTFGALNIYSRRRLRQHDDEQNTEYTWDDRFPYLISAIEPHMPPGTILLGELVVEEPGGGGRMLERFDLAQSYIKSLTQRAVREMES